MTEHEDLKSAIPAYIASRLEGEERRRLEVHLAKCADCSEMVQSLEGFAAAIQDPGGEMFSPHPGVMALRAYARGEAGADSRQIARHLSGCATCELEASAWRFRAVAEEAAPRLRHTEAVTPRPVRLSRSGRFSALSLAAGVVLGVGAAVVFHLGVAPEAPAPLQDAAAGSTTPVYWSGPAPLFVLSSQVRGEDSLLSWRVAPDQPFVLVAIRPLVPDAAAGADLYRFEIRGPVGTAAWNSELSVSRIRQEMEHSEVITFPVPASVLVPGRYEFRFSSLRPGDRQPPLSIPFEVAR